MYNYTNCGVKRVEQDLAEEQGWRKVTQKQVQTGGRRISIRKKVTVSG